MNANGALSRRNCLRLLGAGAALAPSGIGRGPNISDGAKPTPSNQPYAESDYVKADRIRRMKWWHEAKFGMFIHWGLYSVIGQHEWAMELGGVPIADYEQLARAFVPKPHAARNWVNLAKQVGQKYLVMTTKHHEGFCLFDTELTSYCAPKQACGRDLVREFVEATREEGLKVGFYYSLMDWHHPDGARCSTDEAARIRFVSYIHGQIRELMTNYGKVDILWYDVPWPLDANGWESEKMNEMVFKLQPDIIVNNRNKLPGDFSTPEQRIEAQDGDRAWETCMTMNDSWGYQRADDNWKIPKTIIRNIITCSNGGGNYLLNIGPTADGSVPEESVRILKAVGAWMKTNGSSIYNSERCRTSWHPYANFTRRGNTIYVHVHFWPGGTPASEWLRFFNPRTVVAIGGLRATVKSARLLATGEQLDFRQERMGIRFVGLPERAPDDLVTVIAVECESEPIVDNLFVRTERVRETV